RRSGDGLRWCRLRRIGIAAPSACGQQQCSCDQDGRNGAYGLEHGGELFPSTYLRGRAATTYRKIRKSCRVGRRTMISVTATGGLASRFAAVHEHRQRLPVPGPTRRRPSTMTMRPKRPRCSTPCEKNIQRQRHSSQDSVPPLWPKSAAASQTVFERRRKPIDGRNTGRAAWMAEMLAR
ncbi:MAG: hypothetical protein ACI89G_001064, partial [Minisyncoccia bacterium]